MISVSRWMEFGYLDGYPGETRETSGVVSFKIITDGQTEKWREDQYSKSSVRACCYLERRCCFGKLLLLLFVPLDWF